MAIPLTTKLTNRPTTINNNIFDLKEISQKPKGLSATFMLIVPR